MEWGSESAAVRRHRVGGERLDGPAAAPQADRESRAPEALADARGGGARTRKRSAAGSGGASGAAGTGLSEARAALALALYLLALRALVQLSLQQLVQRGATGHPPEFNARQARYWPLTPARACPSRPRPEPGHRTGVHPPLRDRPGSPAPPGRTCGGVPLRVPRVDSPRVVQAGAVAGTAPAFPPPFRRTCRWFGCESSFIIWCNFYFLLSPSAFHVR